MTTVPEYLTISKASTKWAVDDSALGQLLADKAGFTQSEIETQAAQIQPIETAYNLLESLAATQKRTTNDLLAALDDIKSELSLLRQVVKDNFKRDDPIMTQLGSAWEKLAVVAAEQGLGLGKAGYRIDGLVKEERLRRITEVLNRLEHAQPGEKATKPDWAAELAYVLKGGGEDIPVAVVCDIYAEDTTNKKKYAFELKAPLPNSDQTKVSKEKILKLYAMKPHIEPPPDVAQDKL